MLLFLFGFLLSMISLNEVRKLVSYDVVVTEYVDLLGVAYLTQWNKWILSCNIVLCTVKLFKYVSASAKLNLLVNTIFASIGDVLLLIVILFILAMGFALAFHVSFAGEVFEMRTFSNALYHCWFALFDSMGGREEMINSNPAIAVPLLSMYMLLATIVALSIFIAVIEDTYEELKEQKTSDDPFLFAAQRLQRRVLHAIAKMLGLSRSRTKVDPRRARSRKHRTSTHARVLLSPTKKLKASRDMTRAEAELRKKGFLVPRSSVGQMPGAGSTSEAKLQLQVSQLNEKVDRLTRMLERVIGPSENEGQTVETVEPYSPTMMMDSHEEAKGEPLSHVSATAGIGMVAPAPAAPANVVSPLSYVPTSYPQFPMATYEAPVLGGNDFGGGGTTMGGGFWNDSANIAAWHHFDATGMNSQAGGVGVGVGGVGGGGEVGRGTRQLL